MRASVRLKRPPPDPPPYEGGECAGHSGSIGMPHGAGGLFGKGWAPWRRPTRQDAALRGRIFARDEHLWKDHTSGYYRRMPYLSFTFVCLISGSIFILMKEGAVWFSPTTIGAWRLIAGAAVLAIVGWQSRGRPMIGRRDLGPIAFIAVFGFAWPFCLQPYLVARDGSAFIGMMVSFTPLLTIAASIPLLAIYPARRQLLGGVAALGFMSLLMYDSVNCRIPVPLLTL